MSEIERIVWGAIFAVAVYVVGQLLSKFLIEPLYELRKSVGKVRFTLAFHAPTIHTPIGRTPEASTAARDALMTSSCELISKLHAVPVYAVTRHLAFGALPPGKLVEKAAVQLRGLSTYMFETDRKANDSIEVVAKRVESVMQKLRLRPLEGE